MERILGWKSIAIISIVAVISVIAFTIALFSVKGQGMYFGIINSLYIIGVAIFAISSQYIVTRIGIKKLKTDDWSIDPVYSRTARIVFRLVAILLVIVFIWLSFTMTSMPSFLLLIVTIIIMELEYSKIIISNESIIVSNKIITFSAIDGVKKSASFFCL